MGDFQSGYVRRVVDVDLDELLPRLPAVLLDGPKGVGKTATALQRAATVRRLDDPEQRAIAEASVAVAVSGLRPVLLDEWHRVPAVWDAVKRAVDESPAGGQFLLTGSAPTGATHSGAGRIVSMRIRPLTIGERGAAVPAVSLRALLSDQTAGVEGTCQLGLEEYTDLIVSSGLPGLQHLRGRDLQVRLDGYLDRIVDTEMEEAGLKVRREATVRGWLRAYAAATSTTATWETIRGAATPGATAKPARSTTLPYVDVLSRLRILDELQAWSPSNNHLKRLTQAPKHHLSDPALAARLVGVTHAGLLEGGAGSAVLPRDGTFLGALFESLATLSVRVFAQSAGARVSHLRVRDGEHEVDLVVERDDGRVLAIEVKLSGVVTDRDVRHLRWLRRTIGEQLIDSVVLTTGTVGYRRSDGIAVVPLGLLGP